MDYGGFPDSSVGKASTCSAGDPSSIPGSERSPGEVKAKGLALFNEAMSHVVQGHPRWTSDTESSDKMWSKPPIVANLFYV